MKNITEQEKAVLVPSLYQISMAMELLDKTIMKYGSLLARCGIIEHKVFFELKARVKDLVSKQNVQMDLLGKIDNYSFCCEKLDEIVYPALEDFCKEYFQYKKD
jgi:hypothetical protein